MTFKELIRSALTGEMEDISACGDDAGLFAAAPGGGEMGEFFEKLAGEKRERLKELGRIFREGTGFRQRKSAPSRSLEAALRARAVRSGEAAAVYVALSRQLNKPEYKEALKGMAERELEILAAVRKFQTGLNR